MIETHRHFLKRHRTEWQADSRLARSAAALAAGLFVLFLVVLALIFAPGPVTLNFLVGLWGNTILLYVIICAALILLLHTGPAIRRSLRRLWRLIIEQLQSARRLVPSHLVLPAKDTLQWWRTLRTFLALRYVWLVAVRAGLISPAKGPFLLFRRAPLLVTP